jgi:glycosyltransferase involved in cell wall biosynthesis
LHILYLHQHFSPPEGNGNNRSLELAEAWIALGHRVTILCGKGHFAKRPFSLALFHRLNINGIEVIRLNVGYSHFFSFHRRVLSFLLFALLTFPFCVKYRKADVVYASSTPLTVGLLGLCMKIFFRIKFIFETVDLWPDVPIEMGILKNKLLKKSSIWLEKTIYQNCDHIVCLSEGMKYCIDNKGVDPKKITVAHNGTNCKQFTPHKQKASAKIRLGFGETDFVMLYAGTVGQANGLEFWVDVMANMTNECIYFVVLGDGKALKRVENYAKEKNLSRICFHQRVPKNTVHLYFDAADVGVVSFAPYPILNTNSANKFFDYLASGLPVLINYEGWQAQYLSEYACGIRCLNAHDMAEQLERLAKDPYELKKMGENARKLAVEKFDRKNIAQAIARLFV